MNACRFTTLAAAVGATAFAAFPSLDAAPPAPPWFTWFTVVNNNDLMPTEGCAKDPAKCKPFNSYNQPSVNERGLVVIRARSRGGQGDTGGHGGGEHEGAAVLANDDGGGGGGGSGTDHGNQPVHGIYTRDMSSPESPGLIVRVLDRKTEVPQPNNIHRPPENSPNSGPLTTFIETPSFPRIDMLSDTIATRGNHQPVWKVLDSLTGEILEQLGTTGIYTNPFGDLITGASKLGAIPDFEFFAVPGVATDPPTMFDVFPGAPAVTGETTIVFKGNFTVEGEGKTGVFYRELLEQDINEGPGGGDNPVVLIANNLETEIPGTDPPVIFGSTSPPSAATGPDGRELAVFAGFDNEQDPNLGGIYVAPLMASPPLTELVSIGQRVPGESRDDTFNGLGEGGAFDGRFVGFWGTWGEETKTVRLYCPTEGNRDRIAYCNRNLVCEEGGAIQEDENSVCNDIADPNYSEDPDKRICYQDKEVPVNQGIFVHDIDTRSTRTVAKTGEPFNEFLFWNYSGKPPCAGSGHSSEGDADDGEPARWRSSAFVAVSGLVDGSLTDANFHAAFKARTGELVGGVYVDPVDGIYLRKGPGQGQPIVTVLDTTIDGQLLDPDAPVHSTITELGLEREGLRGDWLAVSAKMGIEGGEEEDGMAGVYLTTVPK